LFTFGITLWLSSLVITQINLTMKKIILISFTLVCTTLIHAQEIKFSVAPTANYAPHYNSVTGGPGQTIKTGFSSSVGFLFPGEKKINFGFGLTYQFSKVGFYPDLFEGERLLRTEKVNLFSFSIRSVYNIKPGYYISLDPSFDFHSNHQSDQILDNQTGIGASFGIGKNIPVSETVSLNLEPKIWIHNIVKLDSESYPYRLTTLGLNLGLLIGK
jgi:hypothetical protein